MEGKSMQPCTSTARMLMMVPINNRLKFTYEMLRSWCTILYDVVSVFVFVLFLIAIALSYVLHISHIYYVYGYINFSQWALTRAHILLKYRHCISTSNRQDLYVAPIGKRIRKSFLFVFFVPFCTLYAIPLCKLCVCYTRSHLSYMANWWNGKMLNEWMVDLHTHFAITLFAFFKWREKKTNVNDV